MELYESITQILDLRSFSNLWFWIFLAIIWSTTSHWVIGIPYDLIIRAKRHGGEAMKDLEDCFRININRMEYILVFSGYPLLSFASFMLTVLGILGFGYNVELAQAIFLISFPMSIVALVTIHNARRMTRNHYQGLILVKKLQNHRIIVQFIGMLAVLITALWGTAQNFLQSPLPS